MTMMKTKRTLSSPVHPLPSPHLSPSPSLGVLPLPAPLIESGSISLASCCNPPVGGKAFFSCVKCYSMTSPHYCRELAHLHTTLAPDLMAVLAPHTGTRTLYTNMLTQYLRRELIKDFVSSKHHRLVCDLDTEYTSTPIGHIMLDSRIL